MRPGLKLPALALSVATAFGCAPDPAPGGASGSGGSDGSGGEASGGHPGGTGGAPSTGGARSSGGSSGGGAGGSGAGASTAGGSTSTGGSASTGGTPPTSADAAPPDGAPPPGPPTYTLTISGLEIPPGGDVTDMRCEALGNAEPVLVVAFHLDALPGLHHSQTSVRRSADASHTDHLVFGTSVGARDVTWALPEGYATELPADSSLCLEYHYVNPTDSPMAGGATVGVWTTPPRPEIVHAGIFALQTTDIHLPPMSRGSATFTCAFPSALEVLAIVPHTHWLGRRLSAVRAGGPADGAPLGAWTDLVEPPMKLFRPGESFGAGDGIAVTCDWQNDTTSAVGYGGFAADEMCMLAGFYAPGDDFIAGTAGGDAGPCVADVRRP